MNDWVVSLYQVSRRAEGSTAPFCCRTPKVFTPPRLIYLHLGGNYVSLEVPRATQGSSALLSLSVFSSIHPNSWLVLLDYYCPCMRVKHAKIYKTQIQASRHIYKRNNMWERHLAKQKQNNKQCNKQHILPSKDGNKSLISKHRNKKGEKVMCKNNWERKKRGGRQQRGE